MKKNWGKREGVFLFCLRVFIFREGVFAMRMKHPPCPLHKGDLRFCTNLGANVLFISSENPTICHSDDRREEESRIHPLYVIEILR